MKYKQYINLTSIEMEEQLKNTSFNSFILDERVAPIIEKYDKELGYPEYEKKNGAIKLLSVVKKHVWIFLRSKCKKSIFFCH